MSDTVVIKSSTRRGRRLVLSESADYNKLKEDIAEKFRASATFLGEESKGIEFQGRVLSDEQKLEIIDIIHANCNLSIVCIIEDNPELDKRFMEKIKKFIPEETMKQETVPVQQQMPYADSSTGQFFKGNLRSGQVLDVETSIIVIGDVKPGAKVISKGNVIILGSLKGNVYAGSGGNVNAFVVALDMNPLQIRIADTIARAPDNPKKNPVKETKIAFWDDGNIYIEPLNKDVMGDIRL